MIRIGKKPGLSAKQAGEIAGVNFDGWTRKGGAYSVVFLHGEDAYVFVEAERVGAKAALIGLETPHVPRIELVRQSGRWALFHSERLWPLHKDAERIARRIHQEFWQQLDAQPLGGGWAEIHAAAAVAAADFVEQEFPAMESLARTIRLLADLAYDTGLVIELNRRDIMQRADGTLVFVDPFYIE